MGLTWGFIPLQNGHGKHTVTSNTSVKGALQRQEEGIVANGRRSRQGGVARANQLPRNVKLSGKTTKYEK